MRQSTHPSTARNGRIPGTATWLMFTFMCLALIFSLAACQPGGIQKGVPGVRTVVTMPADDHPNGSKIVLTLGGIGINDNSILIHQVSAFNSTSKDYFVDIRDYAADLDITNLTPAEIRSAQAEIIGTMNLEILRGEGPDILYGGAIDLSVYESKSLLVDLYPLMEKDGNFVKEDLLPCVYESCETDGRLYKIGIGFRISGFVGASSVIGNRAGWTYEEFAQVADALPDTQTMLPHLGFRQSDLLEILLQGSLSDFADTASGSVDFKTAGFYELLRFAKENGRDDDLPADEGTVDGVIFNSTDDAGSIATGRIAVTHTEIYSPETYSLTVSLFGEPVSVVGYPSPNRNAWNCKMRTLLAISAQSASVEGCWSFVKSFYSEEAQAYIANSREVGLEFAELPALRSAFEKEIQDAMIEINQSGEYDPPDRVRMVYVMGYVGNSTFGYMSEYTPMTEDMAVAFRELAENSGPLLHQNLAMFEIIREEAPYYFNDQKSAEEVAEIIQDRVKTLVQERS